MVEGNRGHHMSMLLYLGKILIMALWGIKCSKLGVLAIISRSAYLKFLVSCMMVKGNKGHHSSMISFWIRITSGIQEDQV